MSDQKNQRSRILELLIEAKGGWVGLPEILDLRISQYSARICEARRLGFNIQSKVETDPATGEKHSWFRLMPNESAETPTPPRIPPPESAWADRPRKTGLPLWDEVRP